MQSTGRSLISPSLYLLCIQHIFHFGLFHIVQAYTHKHCSCKQQPGSRVKRFQGFVPFGWQPDLDLASLQLTMIGLDPFQACRALPGVHINCFLFSLSSKSAHSWEPLVRANTASPECSPSVKGLDCWGWIPVCAFITN